MMLYIHTVFRMLDPSASNPPRRTPATAQQACDSLPAHIASAVWPGHLLGRGTPGGWPSGHPALDAELPGGGWPAQALSEVIQAQPGLAEWRLLLPTLRQVIGSGGHVLLIAPPHAPHLPGLAQQGLPPERVFRVDAATPAERLWATEQALLGDGLWAVLSWLPQARPDQVRRLQVCASQQAGPAFLFRPERAMAEASAAPLRLHLSLGPCPHPLVVRIVKRRGPLLDAPLQLATWPPGLMALLPPVGAEPLAPPSPSLAPPALPPTGLPATHHAKLDRPAAHSLP